MKHCSMNTLIIAIIVALAIGVYAGKNMLEEEYYGIGRGGSCTRSPQCNSKDCRKGKCM